MAYDVIEAVLIRGRRTIFSTVLKRARTHDERDEDPGYKNVQDRDVQEIAGDRGRTWLSDAAFPDLKP